MISRRLPGHCVIGLLLLGAILAHRAPSPIQAAARPVSGAPPVPLVFEPNAGQDSPDIRYRAQTPAGLVRFGLTSISLPSTPAAPALQLTWLGAGTATLSGQIPLAGRVNYLRGADPAGWQTGLPTYGALLYTGLYPGINLRYAGDGHGLKGTYIVAAGQDPAPIRWRYSGAADVRLDSAGALLIAAALGPATTIPGVIREAAPVAWQDGPTGRQPVAARYLLAADGTISFALGAYDPTRPLILDPSLEFSTYFGGVGGEAPYDSAVDGDGNLVIVGYTSSSHTYPPEKPLVEHGFGYWDAVVTKLKPDGQTLVFSTYLSGTKWDVAYGVALDAAGNIYVTGETSSSNFPLRHPYQAHNGGGPYDGFLTKLSPDGELLYSTFLGGSNADRARGVGVDAAGTIIVAGFTDSANFPRQNPGQDRYGGGLTDGFVTAFSPDGASLRYSTYLGGSKDEQILGLAVDAAGRAVLTGWTRSTDFPLLNPLQGQAGGGLHDVFITRLAADGRLDYSTYLGGGGIDEGQALALGAAGAIYLTGWTDSSNFPTAHPLQDRYAGGSSDVFVTQIAPDGKALVYSTHLGGSTAGAFDQGLGIAVAADGAAYVVGRTESQNFPLHKPLQTTRGGSAEGFVVKLPPDGTGLTYSTYLGGEADDAVNTVAVAGPGVIYVAGETYSLTFPTLNPYQTDRWGAEDLFMARLTDTEVPPLTPRPVQSPGPMPTYIVPSMRPDDDDEAPLPEAPPTVGPAPVLPDATATPVAPDATDNSDETPTVRLPASSAATPPSAATVSGNGLNGLEALALLVPVGLILLSAALYVLYRIFAPRTASAPVAATTNTAGATGGETPEAE